jgi:GntR family transcriptional regulator/MocR family aminotransferase
VLGLEQKKVWVEDPGFPFTRRGLELARLSLAPIPVDADGIDVSYGLQHAPDAALAVVTPGQQAPLGSTLSLERRSRLLDWAARSNAWVIEDDYLSELQLKGRATPALASLDRAGRVIHIGSFSKTVTPSLRLGFVVAPAALASRFAEAAACLAPAPGPAVQFAMAEFIRDGHYLRHLRRTKRAYAAQGDALLKYLRPRTANVAIAGLAAVLRLPDGAQDLAIARQAMSSGLAPTPLSLWYASTASARTGLLLGIATSPQRKIEAACDRLLQIIDDLKPAGLNRPA